MKSFTIEYQAEQNSPRMVCEVTFDDAGNYRVFDSQAKTEITAALTPGGKAVFETLVIIQLKAGQLTAFPAVV